ncbi:hypothetical protein HO133_002526 [Letharia lupina]|uniref:Uncharacterized protein n=1 Tax=Letharia lupina TaxID=560253 RepID=A0A8H6CCM5_9LECA|nr:uncharacterized protein HO133_002526 [Letharia lupina]KAF6220846.1 hypothetical protein HO133_002526 [Letharia lupina]
MPENLEREGWAARRTCRESFSEDFGDADRKEFDLGSTLVGKNIPKKMCGPEHGLDKESADDEEGDEDEE